MKRPLLLAAVVSLIGLPLCIFIHELGHYAAARGFGWRTRLFPDKVSYWAEVTPGQRLVFLTAGPAIDIILILAGFAILLSFRNRSDAPQRWLFWVGTLLAFVSIKWLLTPLGALLTTTNDERQISEIMGWNGMALPLAAMVAGCLTLFLLGRLHRRHGSFGVLAIVPFAGGAGAGIWIKLLGPLLLGPR